MPARQSVAEEVIPYADFMAYPETGGSPVERVIDIRSIIDARMKAAVIYEHGGPGSIRYEKSFPDPKPGPDDVIVRVGATSLNYHDIFTRRGMCSGSSVRMRARR